jgi:hypothetical protein
MWAISAVISNISRAVAGQPGSGMKAFGILILIVGLVLGGYALTMDVGVHVVARDFGYGISTPEMRVANVDLMTQRQNYLIFSGILSVVGAILTGFGSMRPAGSTPLPTSNGGQPFPSLSANPSQAAAPQTVSICPKCRHLGSGDDAECARCGAQIAEPSNRLS